MKKMISRRNFLKVAGASAAALGLAACGGSSSSTAASTASSTAASAAPAAAGKVYYLNFKPEQDQAWQDLAAVYTKQTGVPVTVVTAASGQYETTLMSEMEKSEAPTLFQVNGPVGLANWKDYCLDLSGSDVYGQLTSDSFALKDGDAVTSIAYVIETYGIIYNKELLTAAGYTQDDIKGFDDLKKVADDIQARKAELGVDGAFTSAGMDGSSDWRFKTHLANMPIYYEYKADGIIYEQMKYCDYWGFERALASYIMNTEYGWPVLSIDRVYNNGYSGQLRTRVQAFVESLEIKKIQAQQ